MGRTTRITLVTAIAVATVAALGTAGALAKFNRDFGVTRDSELAKSSDDYFGVGKPIAASSTVDMTAAEAQANPAGLLTVAKGLKVHVISSGVAAPNIDQMVLWPASHPSYLIGCNEEGTAQPALEKISLSTGAATTIASGLTSCDPVRATPWGTVIFGEEGGATGAMYEIIDPLSVEAATIDRVTGISSSPNIRRVDAFGFLSFEGLGVLPNGVTYFGDELSAPNGAPGGSYFKFVPTSPWVAGSPAIASLDQSPYASGSVFGLRIGQGSNFGQGFSYGTGTWQALSPTAGAQLRPLAATAKLTGYYRPEDMDLDAQALTLGQARMCMNNTGRDAARYDGEAVCLTDGPVAGTTSGASVPEIRLLVQGSSQFNMPDNIAYQPGRGNWVIEEDGSTADNIDGARNNDIWSCLDDGQDDDTLSDGCVRIATVNDLDAETTGGFFDPSGKHYIVSIQHNSSGFGTILDITGWN